MTLVLRRPLACLGTALVLYLIVGFAVGGVGRLDLPLDEPVTCPTAGADDDPALTVLQGNLWMLPSRPLLPISTSADRVQRLERLIHAIRTCRPAVVLLQEVFERSVATVIAEHLPGYEAVSSGRTDLTRTMNASGLLTLTRLPVEDVRFHPFAALPSGSRLYEVLARKGVLAVDLDVGGRPTTILNVHLHGARIPAETAAATRRAQLGEVLAVARTLEARGRRVLVGGDFNLPRELLASELPAGWSISEHGPTYEPDRNPYTLEGRNRYLNRDDRAPRTIDFLLTAPRAGVTLSSQILDELLVSDHEFLHHVVRVET